MFKVNFRSSGNILDCEEIKRQLPHEIKKVLHTVNAAAKKTLLKNSLLPKHGVKYENLKRRSSAAGEPSARQSGDKVRNTTFNIYTNRSEFGTKESIKYGEKIESTRHDNEIALRSNLHLLRSRMDLMLNELMKKSKPNQDSE